MANGTTPDILVLAEVGDAQLISELTGRLKLKVHTPLQVFEPPAASDETGLVVLALTKNVATLTRIDSENRSNTVRPRALSVKVDLASPNCPPLYVIGCH